MSKSYTPPDRSTYDPGWNDPPPMPVPNVDGTANKPVKAKLNLNKRIAFPMAGVSGSPSSSSNVKTTTEGLPLPFSTAKYQTPPSVFQPAPSAPEVTPATLPLPPPAAVPLPIDSSASLPNESSPVASTDSADAEKSIDLSTAREFCQSIFSRLTGTLAEKLDAGKMVEIRKRLDILNGMWLDNKLDQSIQVELYNIAKALDENNVESAKELHRQLVVNHINACHQWGTALRQIILSIDEAHGEQSIQDGPAVLPDNEVNVVQLLNVSSTAHVIDGAIPFSMNPIDPPALLESNDSASLPTPTPINEIVNEGDSGTPPLTNEPRISKSKFGRILHI